MPSLYMTGVCLGEWVTRIVAAPQGDTTTTARHLDYGRRDSHGGNSVRDWRLSESQVT
jgi:hypothetical protein